MINVHVLLREGLARRQLAFHDEASLQKIVGEILSENGLLFTRELKLSGESRIDFFVSAHGIGIETKIKGEGLNTVLRQLKRYADHPSIRELILVCARPWGVPDTLSDKPLHCVAYFAQLV